MSQVETHEELRRSQARASVSLQTQAPHSYFDELAEMGSLQEFLNTYMKDEFHDNRRFRKQMLCLMLDHSVGLDPELEQELIGDLHNALHHFIVKAESCNPTQH